MMIAAVGAWRPERSPELGPQDDDRFIEQVALLEVFDQSGDWPIDLTAQCGMPGLEVRRVKSQAPAPPFEP